MDEPLSVDCCVQTTYTRPQNVVNSRTEMNAHFYGASESSEFNIGTFFIGREGRKERRDKHEKWVAMGLGNLTQIKKELSKA